MTKPIVWALDIDGVINALAPSRNQWPEGDWKAYTMFLPDRGLGYNFWVSDTVLKFIHAVHQDDAVEIVWLTTWLSHANSVVGLELGLPAFPVWGETSSGKNRAPWWKHEAVLDNLKPEQSLIWTDDDLVFYPSAKKLATERGLGIAPNPHAGLKRSNLRRISDYIENKKMSLDILD